LSNSTKYGSLAGWVRVTNFKNSRNKHECEALADAIDTLLSEGVDENSLGVEKLVRRLGGIHAADTTGNWNVCDALLWSGPNNSLLSRSTLTSALKSAASYQSLSRRVSGTGGRGFTQRQRGGGDHGGSRGGSFSSRGGSFGSRGGGGSFGFRGGHSSRGGSGTSSSAGSASQQ
jgi:hypothetical protein